MAYATHRSVRRFSCCKGLPFEALGYSAGQTASFTMSIGDRPRAGAENCV